MINSSDKQYVASISYGKDSLAMLHVITDVLHWRLDRIVTADVWATDDISADIPQMVEFKDYADRVIKDRYGIDVEHFCAMRDGSRITYSSEFYHKVGEKRHKARLQEWKTRTQCRNECGIDDIYGFPLLRAWCNNLKMKALRQIDKQTSCAIKYIGIAADEGNRTERHKKKVDDGKELLPLVEAEWTEQMCRDWCKDNGLLSPIYETASRGGCWFCNKQGVQSLRLLRRNYPELWAMLLEWDEDSPITFKPDGHSS